MPTPESTETFPPLHHRAIVLTGATASGKSAAALELAETLGGEILSLDSIAVYRGMDIGTAKPDATDQARVPHHLIDLAEPTDSFSVACYLKAAHRCVDDVCQRGHRPIFVGGTPMFLKAILRGFDPGPPPNWDFRQSVEKDLEKHGAEALLERLRQVDPLSATRIAPGDTRRMIRALEVSMQTGQPLSHRQVQFDRATDAKNCSVFSLQHQRQRLHQRINTRVDRMFDQGLIHEVQTLINQHGQLSRTAAQAVGYREVIEWLNQGGPKTELINLVATHTRQLAKRQETWFRSFTEITTLPINDDNQHAVVPQILAHLDGLPD